MARASGVDVDLRRDAPYGIYDRLHINVVLRDEGDVWARTLVRVLETIESLRLCRQLLRDGAPGLHIYTLNRAHATERLLERLLGA